MILTDSDRLNGCEQIGEGTTTLPILPQIQAKAIFIMATTHENKPRPEAKLVNGSWVHNGNNPYLGLGILELNARHRDCASALVEMAREDNRNELNDAEALEQHLDNEMYLIEQARSWWLQQPGNVQK